MYDVEKEALRGTFTFLPIEDVYYGAQAVNDLGECLAASNVKNALLITGNTLANKTSLVEQVMAAANNRIKAVYTGTQQHVHRDSVLGAIEKAHQIGADAVVSFGGGTPNDTGKAVLLGLAENVNHVDDFDRYRVKFEYPDKVEVPPISGATLPMFAISTTLSGGEFTHFAGVTDSARQVKDLYIDKKLTAKAVFLDPALTLETPDWLWLSTGMRSVDHCIESLCSTSAHPFTDALAARSLNMLNRYLRECRADPSDLVARTQAHIAAWMSVCGLANVNLGLSHGIGHQLGARNDVPHGVTSCVMMHPTMNYNKDHVGSRQAWIAEILGHNIAGLTTDEASTVGRDAVKALVSELDLPTRLRDVGVEPDDFAAIAKDAMEDLVVASNPRPVGSVEDVIELLHTAY
ncbi:MAG: iron-containing alcohol dehydrogenase [Gammaproteobacteria bacterium]